MSAMVSTFIAAPAWAAAIAKRSTRSAGSCQGRTVTLPTPVSARVSGGATGRWQDRRSQSQAIMDRIVSPAGSCVASTVTLPSGFTSSVQGRASGRKQDRTTRTSRRAFVR